LADYEPANWLYKLEPVRLTVGGCHAMAGEKPAAQQLVTLVEQV
jgi:hypothetical protein